MRILFLTSRFPFPLEKGDKLRAYYQLRELSRHHEIILVAVSDQKVEESSFEALKPFCKKIVVHEMSMAKAGMHLFRTLFSSKPFQVGYFYSTKFQLRINEIIKRDKPDMIFCQLTRMAEYVKHVKHIPKTLDYMDAFSTGLERVAKHSPLPKKIAVKAERHRLKKYERYIFDYFEYHTIISEQDKKLIPHERNESITVVPNGVDFDYYSPQQAEKKYDLIFYGNMNYPPNIESALFISNKVMPLLLKKNPEIKFVIAGATPSIEIEKLKGPNTEVTGWVEDIREYIAASRIHLAPMFSSIGLQNKILQAMAMKVPCIVSTLSNNAIHAPVNDCVLIADTPEEFADKITLLLSNPQQAEEMAGHAHHFVSDNFNWKSTINVLEKMWSANGK